MRYFQHIWPDTLWLVPTPKKIVALTIDDAPTRHTDDLLEILEKNNAKATFFIIGGSASGREKTLEKMVRGGHELGNHTMEDKWSLSLGENELRSQLHDVQQKIIQPAYDAVNKQYPPNYFRPGSGFFSTWMRKLSSELNHRLVLGSVYPHDPQISLWWINAIYILMRVHPGAIIICHDRQWTAPMLAKVLPELKRRSYEIVTLTELLRDKN